MRPFFSWVPAGGRWRTTSPSWLWSLTSRSFACTWKPAPVTWVVASASVSPLRSGTSAVSGPLDTVSFTWLFLFAIPPPAGDCAMTVPTGWSENWGESL